MSRKRRGRRQGRLPVERIHVAPKGKSEAIKSVPEVTEEEVITPPETNTAKEVIRKKIQLVLALAFWIYSPLKVLVYDIDVALLNTVQPYGSMIYNARAYLVAATVAILLMVYPTKDILLMLTFIVLFPFWIVIKLFFRALAPTPKDFMKNIAKIMFRFVFVSTSIAPQIVTYFKKKMIIYCAIIFFIGMVTLNYSRLLTIISTIGLLVCMTAYFLIRLKVLMDYATTIKKYLRKHEEKSRKAINKINETEESQPYNFVLTYYSFKAGAVTINRMVDHAWISLSALASFLWTLLMMIIPYTFITLGFKNIFVDSTVIRSADIMVALKFVLDACIGFETIRDSTINGWFYTVSMIITKIMFVVYAYLVFTDNKKHRGAGLRSIMHLLEDMAEKQQINFREWRDGLGLTISWNNAIQMTMDSDKYRDWLISLTDTVESS